MTDQQQSVIGFTEAELGFFLAMMLLLLFVIGQATHPSERSTTAQVPETTMVRAQVLEMKSALDRLRADSVEKAHLESGIWPACDSKERQLTTGPLFHVLLLDDGRLRLGAVPVTARELATRYSSDLQRAQSSRCRHRIVLDFAAALPADLLVTTRGRLEQQTFRVSFGRVVR